MKMPDLHARLLADVLAIGSPYPLVIMGGYAVQAHRLVSRPSQDLDVATENPAPMTDIATTLREGLEARGWQVEDVEISGTSGRFIVTEPTTGDRCEVDVLKEVFYRPPVDTPIGPVLAEEDVIGTKIRALADRGLPRDLIDMFAASNRWSNGDLEMFGRRHHRGPFDLDELQTKLFGAEWIDDAEFEAYGLDTPTIHALRTWAQSWAEDLAERLHGDEDHDA
ncbi:nucleotidyl transferase AbiEii/AbiGii toxin family protein [Streptomyces sp. VRA16 Mangrove soil]|uniref:nucleotidyl transferase AbiEii/AbiGii toxin family protein n=1 Tax=Streptomyces sp. VRA16 Mangrove soil TaxID=2817434 RepID=UPI001A9EEF1B|nr:nucleotidyl transferase AbiEii/AbiGii toxin family protein [Streptomyces sp. VRA16 Mangrove soil]MBO1337842.1 nucleotidyl transferase AbiEii/AbiGii toxin family protein [Streptomyces sp. VRA16 Mangrove soil]